MRRVAKISLMVKYIINIVNWSVRIKITINLPIFLIFRGNEDSGHMFRLSRVYDIALKYKHWKYFAVSEKLNHKFTKKQGVHRKMRCS